MRNSKYTILMIVLVFSVLATTFAQADKLYQERIYEPVVLKGSVLKSFYNVPVNEIYMYAYDDATQAWRMMPFQIDEQTYGFDPFSPSNKRWFYFIPEQWAGIDSLPNNDWGVLSDHDELVFMVRDLGDQAPQKPTSGGWINNEESKNYQRLEISLSDPNDNSKIAFGYLFRSSTISENVPNPYQFSYDPESQTIENENYVVSINDSIGLIKDIILKPPLGNGVDIFDTQKIRFAGEINFGFSFTIGRGDTPAGNERDFFWMINEKDTTNYYHEFTQKPIVRLVREVRQSFRVGTINFADLGIAFYVPTKFYPFSGTIEGGAELSDSTLQKMFPNATDPFIELDLLRQSWDLNANAIGMKFYNKYNNGIEIDGSPDEYNKTLDIPIREWTLVSGVQGSFFSLMSIKDTTWTGSELYYYDNSSGGQGDGTIVPGGDTGDQVSYGDHGILMKNGKSLELGFTGYFLPGNLTQADGEQIAYYILNPVKSSSLATGVQNNSHINILDSFELLQNFPNPFNNETFISFQLAHSGQVSLTIYDIRGRKIASLYNGKLDMGLHKFKWNGKNQQLKDVSSGVYFYELKTNDIQISKKLVLIR